MNTQPSAQAPAKPVKGLGGRPANAPIKMFKLLVVQRYYNLSDAPMEYQVRGWLTFQKFVGWTMAAKLPDANPLGQLGKWQPLSKPICAVHR